jgi:Raf kinase inhibitor-like YbhB/YbcL family protein
MRPLIGALLLLGALTPSALANHGKKAKAKLKTLDVMSTAFREGEDMPAQYTCDGAGEAPPLNWAKVPGAAKSVAVIVEDPDAPKGTFTHWVVVGIRPTDTLLASADKLPDGATAGKNDKGSDGWTPPCPPSGKHHYVFRVYALDAPLTAIKDRTDFDAAIAGHVLAEGHLTGMYEKAKAKP